MNKPQLYERANVLQRRDAQKIMKEFSFILKWRLDGKDSLLDVGCGSGDVLMDFIYPIVPKDFKKIVGCDISPEMVRYCKKNYSQKENVDFKILDIGTESLPKEFISEFDHVTSFYCLNWSQNQLQVVKNIYQLLQPNGDCLLVFLAFHQMYDIYKSLSMFPKWTPYMKDVNSNISPYHFVKNPHKIFEKLLEYVGFVEYNVELRDEIFVYEGLDIMRRHIKSIIPFIDRIPISMQEEFLDEIITATVGLNLGDSINEEQKCITPYKLIVAYAKK